MLVTECIIFEPPKQNKSIGIAAPVAYARVMSMVEKVVCPVAARVVIVANIGPAHGVHKRPSAMPSTKPLIKCSCAAIECSCIKLPIKISNLNNGIVIRFWEFGFFHDL